MMTDLEKPAPADSAEVAAASEGGVLRALASPTELLLVTTRERDEARRDAKDVRADLIRVLADSKTVGDAYEKARADVVMLAEALRERDEALATLALYRTNPAECIHCGDTDTSREHWRVCSEHPARADVAMLAEALREIARCSHNDTCSYSLGTQYGCDCHNSIARDALARLKGPMT